MRHSQRPNFTRRFLSSQRLRSPLWVSGLVAAAAAQTWFRPGHHTAAGDVLPFLRRSLSAEVFDLWNHQLTAAGGVSAEIVRFFDLVFIHVFEFFGFAAHTAQRAYFTFLAVFAAVSVARMVLAVATSLTSRLSVGGSADVSPAPSTGVLLASGVAGVLAVLNPYWLVLIPNPIFLAVVGVAAHTAAGVWRAAAGRRPSAALFGLGLVTLTILATNPPLVAVWAGWSLLSVLAAWWVLRPAGWFFWGFCLRAGAVVVLVNVFWMVPLFFTLTAPTTAVAAQVSVEAWSWSHAQNSLANVVGLNAFWGWVYDGVYLPVASRLDEPWWAMMRFALPVASLAAVVYGLAQRSSSPLRRLSVVLSVTAVVTVVLGKGLHPPFAGLNRFLYDHVPGMWLLREPMSKVGWVLLFCYLISIVASLTHFLHRRATRPVSHQPAFGVPFLAAAATLVAGFALAYAHPLYTGEVVPTERRGLPGAYVRLPSGLDDLAAAVDLAASGRVLTLPHSTFYQMGHSWGYYGVDQVYSQLFTAPVVSLSSGGYFGQDPVFVAMAEDVEERILAGDVSSGVRLLGRLGVDVVVVRFDYDPTVSQGGLADPDKLDAALSAFGLEELYRSDLAAAYRVPIPAPMRAVDQDGTVTLSGDASPFEWSSAASLVEPGVVLVSSDVTTPNAVLVGDSPVRLPDLISELRLSQPGLAAFTLNLSGQIYPAAQLFFEDGSRLPLSASSQGHVGSGPIVAARTGDAVFAVDDEVLFLGAPGDEVELFEVADNTVSFLRFRPCSSNTSNSSNCLRAGLPSSLVPSIASHVLVSVGASEEFASPVDACITLDGGSNCVSSASLLPAPGDVDRRLLPAYLLASRAELSEGAELVLRSSHDLELGNVLVVATPVRTVGLVSASLPDTVELPEGSGGKLVRFAHPSEGEVSVMDAALFSDLEDCDRSDSATAEEAGLGFVGSGSSLRLTARRHSACVWANLGVPTAPALRVVFDFEAVSGRQPRFCLWQTAVSRCAEAPPVEGSSGRYDEVVSLDSNSGSVLLFVYADAPSPSVALRTEVVYENISVGPMSQLTALAVSPASDPSPSPLLVKAGRQFPSAALGVDLPPGTLVTVSTSRSDDLVLEADGVAVDAKPVLVDGWAQGWVLSGTLPVGVMLSVEHRSEWLADAALWVSAFSLLAASAFAASGPVRRRFGVRRHDSAAD